MQNPDPQTTSPACPRCGRAEGHRPGCDWVDGVSQTTGTYGLDSAIDPLVEMAQLAHAIEMPTYPWTPKDIVRVLDRGVEEIVRLRARVRELSDD